MRRPAPRLTGFLQGVRVRGVLVIAGFQLPLAVPNSDE
jgi:hypothetical protein